MWRSKTRAVISAAARARDTAVARKTQRQKAFIRVAHSPQTVEANAAATR